MIKLIRNTIYTTRNKTKSKISTTQLVTKWQMKNENNNYETQYLKYKTIKHETTLEARYLKKYEWYGT